MKFVTVGVMLAAGVAMAGGAKADEPLRREAAALFFANAEIFYEHVLQAVAKAPTPTKWVVVAAASL